MHADSTDFSAQSPIGQARMLMASTHGHLIHTLQYTKVIKHHSYYKARWQYNSSSVNIHSQPLALPAAASPLPCAPVHGRKRYTVTMCIVAMGEG